MCSNFAVCSKSGTRQRPFLPCAAIEAHGKVATHGKQLLCRVLAKALGKVEHLPWTGKDTRQRVCRVPDKGHTAKVLFAGRSMPCAICRVLYTANTLPCVSGPLPCALAHGKQPVSRSEEWLLSFWIPFFANALSRLVPIVILVAHGWLQVLLFPHCSSRFKQLMGRAEWTSKNWCEHEPA